MATRQKNADHTFRSFKGYQNTPKYSRVQNSDLNRPLGKNSGSNDCDPKEKKTKRKR